MISTSCCSSRQPSRGCNPSPSRRYMQATPERGKMILYQKGYPQHNQQQIHFLRSDQQRSRCLRFSSLKHHHCREMPANWGWGSHLIFWIIYGTRHLSAGRCVGHHVWDQWVRCEKRIDRLGKSTNVIFLGPLKNIGKSEKELKKVNFPWWDFLRRLLTLWGLLYCQYFWARVGMR